MGEIGSAKCYIHFHAISRCDSSSLGRVMLADLVGKSMAIIVQYHKPGRNPPPVQVPRLPCEHSRLENTGASARLITLAIEPWT